MITKIELVQTLKTMGCATEEDLFLWCDQLRSMLLHEYPGSEISVRSVADTAPNKIHVEVDDENDTTSEQDTVQRLINHCWDMWSKPASSGLVCA